MSNWRIALSLALAIGFGGASPGLASELKDTLDPDAVDHAFESFAFRVYELTVPGPMLSVKVGSPRIDTYVMLRSPSGKITTNDDWTPRSAERVGWSRIAEPQAQSGVWYAVATSYGRSMRGEITVEVEGASNVRRLSVAEIPGDLIESAFRARGVVSEKAERASRILEVREQLSLATFRDRLIEKLEAELSDNRESSLRSGVEGLERRRQELLVAAGEVERVADSKTLLRELVEAEVERVDTELKASLVALSRAANDRLALNLAIEQIRELDGVIDDLDHLEDSIFSPSVSDGSIDADGIRARIADLRSRVSELAESIASKLVDSGFASLALRHSAFAEEMMLMDVGGVVALGPITVTTEAAVGGPPRSHGNPSVWLPRLFPWPPPAASSRVVLSSLLVPGWDARFQTLGDIDDALRAALSRTGYAGASYFGVPEGFALVTPLEQTSARGVSLRGESRWAAALVGMTEFSLREYIRVLLTAPVGHFRVLVFVVTSVPFGMSDSREVFAVVERWSRAGHTHLPESVRLAALSGNHKVTVLVYEFRKTRSAREPLTSIPGRHSAEEHLLVSRLLGALR